MTRRLLPLLEVVTVGLPFCAFKILTGIVLVDRPWLAVVGWTMIVLGALDLVVNVVNFVALAVGRPRALGACVAQISVQRWRPDRAAWHELGLSIDVMLSFVLVAVMIGFGLLPALPRIGLQLWSVAVVLNVLGAGFGRLTSSLGSLKAPAGDRPSS